MTPLVTGFEIFGEHEVNPSQLIAEELDGVVLPVSYERAATALRAAIDEREPDLVVCFGLAHDRTAISVERWAHNLDEATTVDNEGAAGSGRAIDPAGPLALASTLPVDAIVAALAEEGIPAEVSRDAGGYLCNHVFYELMHLIERERPETRGGFIHVPAFSSRSRPAAGALRPPGEPVRRRLHRLGREGSPFIARVERGAAARPGGVETRYNGDT